MTEINRGSEWRKWDLHVHSPHSIVGGSGSYNGITEDDFIDKLLSEEIAVVGLTNYFMFNDKDYDLAEKLRNNGISTFMNLELRLTNINDSDMLSDYHVIFSDELSKNEIESFLSNLNVTVGSSKKKVNTLTDDEIKKNAAISFEELAATLKDESLQLNGKYLTAFLSRGHGNSVSGKNRGYTVYEEITRKSDLIIHATDFQETLEEDKLYWLGKSSHKNKYIKPLLQSSDAHCLNDIGIKTKQVEIKHKDKNHVYEKDDNYYIDIPAYTWIKSNPTFEGLKQIIFEPEERVKYGGTYPVEKSDYMVLDYVEYYDNERVFFNSGLNAIIGGRSTGKSTLLNSIAKHQKNKNFNKDNHYTLKDNEYKVIWRDGKIDAERSVEFIPQEFMINISKERSKLNILLGEIISKRNMDIEERRYKEELGHINSEINSYINDYFLLQSSKKQLIKPEGDNEAAKAAVILINERIEKVRLENKFSEEDNKKYKEVSDMLNLLTIEMELLKKEEERLLEIKNIDFSLSIELDEVSLKNQSLIETELNAIKEDSTKRWNIFIDGLINDVKESEKENIKKIEEIKKTSIYIKGKDLETKNQELSQLEQELKKHKIVIKEFKKFDGECSQINTALEEKHSLILDQFKHYYEASQQFSERFIIEEGDLKIEVNLSTIAFGDKIDYLDARSNTNNTFIDKFCKTLEEFKGDSYKAFFKDWLKEEKFTFNRNKNIDDLFKDIFTTNWYTYDYLITYQNDEFQDMSQGKKSFVILKLLLEFSEDKKPVLIDQPEDSLDNRAIYHELRKYLIDTKNDRQIILVTHNPNIVVGADTENIIVAHQESNIEKNRNGKKFQYINGALENTQKYNETCTFVLESQGIREHIFDVLEGGEEAFTKREQKYNYKNNQ